MEKLKQILDKFLKLSLIKKSIIIFVFFFVVIVAFVFLMVPSQQDFGFLYSELSEEDAGNIVEELKTLKIPYKLSQNGNVLVPKNEIPKARLTLAQKNIVGKGIGFELLDNQKYGMTNFMEQLNYLRALQGELSRTINQLDAVESSRVHIVLPKKAVFKEDNQETTASIVLKLKKNQYLSKQQVNGILHLVASSVQGLKTENISIVDTYGKRLNDDTNEKGFSNSPLEYQRKYEEKLTQQVQEILDRAIGEGNSIVKVEAELDFDEKTEAEENYDPDATAIRSEKLVDEKSMKGDDKIGGIPGAESNNAQTGTTGAGTGTVVKGSEIDKSKKSEIRNYEVSKIVKQLKASIGKVKKISIAVLLNGTYIDKDGKKTYVPRTETEIKTYFEIVKKSVGYNPERGDQVEVANVQFNDIEKEIEKIQPFYKNQDFYFKLLQYLLYIVIIIIVFLVVRSILGWATIKEDEVESSEITSADELKELAGHPELAQLKAGETGIDKVLLPGSEQEAVQKEETMDVKMRRRINEIAYENPDKVLQILRYWISNN